MLPRGGRKVRRDGAHVQLPQADVRAAQDEAAALGVGRQRAEAGRVERQRERGWVQRENEVLAEMLVGAALEIGGGRGREVRGILAENSQPPRQGWRRCAAEQPAEWEEEPARQNVRNYGGAAEEEELEGVAEAEREAEEEAECRAECRTASNRSDRGPRGTEAAQFHSNAQTSQKLLR